VPIPLPSNELEDFSTSVEKECSMAHAAAVSMTPTVAFDVVEIKGLNCSRTIVNSSRLVES
jgi:hypothetical protein